MNAVNSYSLRIYCFNDHETVKYAAKELGKYIIKMMPGDINIETFYNAQSPLSTDGLVLGLFSDLNIPSAGIEDIKMDDAVHVDVTGLKGIIAGTNPRSILFGVYRFLEESGCCWVRHGDDGEFIPERDLSRYTVRLDEKASYRHRGLCIEGAVSYENMLDNIDWAPKLGFNSYFIEFFVPYTFFERWYSHANNRYKEPETLTIEQVRRFKSDMEKEIKKRGMNYHAVGHAWTCECLGIPGIKWEPDEYDVSSDAKELLAMINGERKLFNNVPLNTNLCYSNPEARKRLVDCIIAYIQSNRHIDMLHFWLADEMNNHCECKNCKGTLPSDFYVMIMNELDNELSKKGIDTKIVFLAYEDLLWAPLKNEISNPDRFILLFAPITRTYSKPYETDTQGAKKLPYSRNNIVLPAGIKENIAYLRDWQKVFSGDTIAYEYHFMWDHYHDPGYFSIARILSLDIKKLKSLGINGMISDQTQRSFFPTGLGMYIMGKTLWDDSVDFNKAASKYFNKAFGADGKLCMEYMNKLSCLFDPEYMRGEKRVSDSKKLRDFNLWSIDGDSVHKDPGIVPRLAKISGVVDDFRCIIERNISHPDKCTRKSWEYLRYHADIVDSLSKALLARETGQTQKSKTLWSKTLDMVERYEDMVQPVFDTYEFAFTLEKKFK